jgi:hypothetical protein
MDDAQGLVHYEFIQVGCTVKKEMHIEFLCCLRAVRRKCLAKWTQNSWFLLHNDAPAHRSLVKKYLAKYNVMALEHLLYSPRLVMPDFFQFPQLKSVLKGQHFMSTEEVTAQGTRILTKVSKNGFLELFEKRATFQGNFSEGNAV